MTLLVSYSHAQEVRQMKLQLELQEDLLENKRFLPDTNHIMEALLAP